MGIGKSSGMKVVIIPDYIKTVEQLEEWEREQERLIGMIQHNLTETLVMAVLVGTMVGFIMSLLA